MKLSILKTIIESDIPSFLKCTLDEYINQAFKLKPEEVYQWKLQQQDLD